MKLNFDLCKNCDDKDPAFVNFWGKFCFGCDTCGYFILYPKEYNILKFNHNNKLSDVTNKEWKEIKKMEVIVYNEKWFKECPYYLEHLVEN